MPQEFSSPVQLCWQSRLVQFRREVATSSTRPEMHIEALETRRSRNKGALRVRLLAGPPRGAVGPTKLSAERSHIARKVSSADGFNSQAFPSEPSQVIDQHVRISPGCTDGERLQIAIGRLVHMPIRLDDGERHLTSAENDLLDPQAVQNWPTTQVLCHLPQC